MKLTQRRKPKLSSRAKRLTELAKKGNWIHLLSGAPDSAAEDVHLSITFEERIALLTSLANVRDVDGLAHFWRTLYGGKFPELDGDMIELRDELRALWIGARVSAQKTLDKWLNWRPSQAHLRQYEELGFAGSWNNVPFRCSMNALRLVPNYMSIRAMLIQGVFEHWGYFKKCANPDCATPYFIARRKDQTVCNSEICKAEKQREHALKWWNENRAKGSKGASNVSRKAR